MAQAHKFTDLEAAKEVFPELPWAFDGETTFVDNSKTGERVPVSEGQYIVKIADRYEVHDEAPANAKEAQAPKEASGGAAASNTSAEPTVPPEFIGAPQGSAEAAGTPTADVE